MPSDKGDDDEPEIGSTPSERLPQVLPSWSSHKQGMHSVQAHVHRKNFLEKRSVWG